MSGESRLGVLCTGGGPLCGWVAVCTARTRRQAGARVAVQPARGAETAVVEKPQERAVPERNIPSGCPVPHASASSFCSETMFSPEV